MLRETQGSTFLTWQRKSGNGKPNMKLRLRKEYSFSEENSLTVIPSMQKICTPDPMIEAKRRLKLEKLEKMHI